LQIPGFIDLQINGYKGVDFSSEKLTRENFCYACQEILKAGTAAFLPTLITSSKDVYKKNLPIISSVIESGRFANRILGIHLEGPFISSEPGAVGAHSPEYAVLPSIDYLKELQNLSGGKLKLITIAAELDGADKLTEYAVKNDIVVSLGHQKALEKDLAKLAQAGAASLTHLGNALSNEINRHENPLLAGLADDKFGAMIITDGHHLPPSLIKIILKVKGVPKVIVVSDASPLAGMSPGEYNYWGQKVVLQESGYLHIPARGCMAGSSANMFECMNYLASLDLLNETQLLEVGFYNPLRFIAKKEDFDSADSKVKFNPEDKVFEII
jgi:N-acetylglucosamine-6-phosphate deacetylase